MGKKAASKTKPRRRAAAVQSVADGDPLHLTDSQQQLVEKIHARGVAGLSKADREQIERWGPVFVAAFPKVRYLECAGRQSRTVIDQGKRHDLPYTTTGKSIDLRKQIRWVHDFLARHGQALNSKSSIEDDAFAEADTQLKRDIALEGLRQRRLANEEREINIQKKRGELVPVEPVQEFWADAGQRMQQAIASFRGSGSVAKSAVLKRLNDMLDDLDRMAEEKFGGSDSDTDRAA